MPFFSTMVMVATPGVGAVLGVVSPLAVAPSDAGVVMAEPPALTDGVRVLPG